MERPFIPTYPKLQSYDPYITGGDGSVHLLTRAGSVDDDTKAIEQDIDQYHGQVKKLAALLKANSAEQSAYNVWHFIKNNIAYKKDPPGEQYIRSPYNIWVNRKDGVDCKGMAIFAYSLLLEMGYNPDLVEAAFYGEDSFSHIFARLSGYVIDAVPTMDFNHYAPGITKRMRIYSLNGVPDPDLENIGALPGPDATTIKLKALLAKETNPNERAKLQYVISLDGKPERNILLRLMDNVTKINNDGTFAYKSGVNFQKLNEEIEAMEHEAGIAGTPGEIGKIKIKVNLKSAIKDVEKVGKLVLKYNPATIIVRNALLAVLAIDLFGLSRHLKIGYYTDAEAAEHKLDPTEFKELKNVISKTESLFTDLGGSTSALKDTIAKAGGGISGPEVVAAAGPIAAIMAFLGKVNFSKLVANTPPPLNKVVQDAESKLQSAIKSGAAPKPSTAPVSVGQGVTNAQAAAAASTAGAADASTDNSATPAPAKSGTPGWLLPVGGAAAIAAKLFLFH